MKSTLALVRKELRVALRSPLFAVLGVLVPVAFTLLYAIVIHVSTTATIAVADEAHSAASAELIHVMKGLHNNDGPYYEILTTEPGEARQLYRDGTVGALLTIPKGFGEGGESGPPVRLELVNINADGTKNQHLRLEETLRAFDQQRRGDVAHLQLHETGMLEHDIPITVYLGSALMTFAAIYAGMVNAGTAVAREWEEHTAKELMLAPVNPLALVLGKWLGCALISLGTVALTVVGIALVLDFPLSRLGWDSVLVLALGWLYGAALGTLLGVTMRKSLPLIPVAVILAVTHFLLFGYESYIRGFAHGGAVGPLWEATHWVPLTALFDLVRFEVAELPRPPQALTAAAWSLILAATLTAAAIWRLNRTLRFTQGQ